MTKWYEEYYDAVDGMRADEFLNWLTDDASIQYGNNPPVVGKDNIRNLVTYAWDQMEVLKHNFINIYEANNNKTIFDVELHHVMKDGRVIDIPCCTILERRGEKICKFQSFVDTTPLFTGDIIGQRRSINFFDPEKEVPESLMKKLIDIANFAPSSFNLQPWRVVVVTGSDKKKVLQECAFNQPKVEESSAVLIIIADPAGVEENRDRMLDSWQELGYMEPEMREVNEGLIANLYGEPDSLQRKFFAIKNTALFAMNLMNSAKLLGLDTHAIDGFDEDAVKKAFNIPADKIIPMLVAVGYLVPGMMLLPRAFRRDAAEFVGFDTYK